MGGVGGVVLRCVSVREGVGGYESARVRGCVRLQGVVSALTMSTRATPPQKRLAPRVASAGGGV